MLQPLSKIIFYTNNDNIEGISHWEYSATLVNKLRGVFKMGYHLTLSLFVFRVLTDNSDTTFSFNDFALIANWFYGCSNLH